MKQIYLVYAGPSEISNGVHIYFQLNSLADNTGSRIDDRFKKVVLSKAIVKSIGMIFAAEVDDKTGMYHFKKNPASEGLWRNDDDRMAWQSRRKTVEVSKRLKDDAGLNLIREQVKSIRELYAWASPNERTVILAQVIQAITRG